MTDSVKEFSGLGVASFSGPVRLIFRGHAVGAGDVDPAEGRRLAGNGLCGVAIPGHDHMVPTIFIHGISVLDTLVAEARDGGAVVEGIAPIFSHHQEAGVGAVDTSHRGPGSGVGQALLGLGSVGLHPEGHGDLLVNVLVQSVDALCAQPDPGVLAGVSSTVEVQGAPFQAVHAVHGSHVLIIGLITLGALH